MSQAVERLFQLHMTKTATGGGSTRAGGSLADDIIKRWGKGGGVGGGGKKGMLMTALKTLGIGAGLTAGGVAVAKGVGAIENLYDRRGRGQAFGRMLNEDPELKRMFQSNPKKVVSHFKTLHRFNPEMAKDPLVASSFVKGTAGQDTMTHKTVQDLVSARKSFKDTGAKLPSLPHQLVGGGG